MKNLLMLLVLFLPVNAAYGQDGAESKRRTTIVAPVIHEQFEYYQVCGSCRKDLEAELKKKAVTWSDGSRYDSVTRWDLKWDYRHVSSNGVCYADSFQITADVKITMPKWMPVDAAPHSLIDQWDDYIGKLLAHENGHAAIVRQAADQLTRSVAELPPARTCTELDRQIRTVCSACLVKLSHDQKNYDASSGHGRTQGVSFP